MIRNQDRSKWFGASDTSTIMGNWDTETFKKWWMTKLGINTEHFSNRYTVAGNLMEIPIIHMIEEQEGRKIKLGKRPVYRFRYRIRANYDGLARELIEIKTTKHGFAKVPKPYWQQCQVLMYATGKKEASLYAYHMSEEEYRTAYFPQIDPERIRRFTILYDGGFIKNEYLPRVRYLAWCLRHKKWPKAGGFNV